jgi:hypothetical protein
LNIMKSTFKMNFLLSFILILTILGLSSCSKKDDRNVVNTPALAHSTPALANTITQTLTVDFSISTGIGHAFVFGEQGAPSDANSVASVIKQGFVFKRANLMVNNIVPPSTIDDYRNNVNNIQDPNTWWISTVSTGLNAYGNAGSKVLIGYSYIPSWLSWNPNNQRGVPKDWAIYEDIISKIATYMKARSFIVGVEVWNEPTGDFLDITGSPYTTRLAAYKDIYYHTAKAIRSVDANIPIGGPTAGDSKQWCRDWADSLLSDSRIAANVNFLTYHLYDWGKSTDATDIPLWKAVGAKHGKPNIPVYLDEWNYSYGVSGQPFSPMNNSAPEAISYWGRRLTDFYVNHLDGSTVFTMGVLPATGGMGGINKDGTFTPKIRALYLMSKVLGLGKSDGALKQTTWTPSQNITNAGAALNVNNQKVIWMTNDTADSSSVTMVVKGLSPNIQYAASVWEASNLNTAQTERQSIIFTADAVGTGSFNFAVAAKSVTGFIIK